MFAYKLGLPDSPAAHWYSAPRQLLAENGSPLVTPTIPNWPPSDPTVVDDEPVLVH
jgi:hypothetical protein